MNDGCRIQQKDKWWQTYTGMLTMNHENTHLVIHVQIWNEINRRVSVCGVNRATASKQISTGNLHQGLSF